MGKYGHVTEEDLERYDKRQKQKNEPEIIEEIDIDTDPHKHKYTRSSKAVMWVYMRLFFPFLLFHERLHWASAKLLNIEVNDTILIDEVGATVDIVPDFEEIPTIKIIAVGLAPLCIVPVAFSAAWMSQYFSWWPLTLGFWYVAIGCYLMSRPSIGDLAGPFFTALDSSKKSIKKEPIGITLAFILFIFTLPILILDIIDSRTGLLVDLAFLKLLDMHLYSMFIPGVIPI